MSRLTESGSVRNVHSKHLPLRIHDFFESLEVREESPPELMPTVFAVIEGVVAQIQLKLDDLIDGAVLEGMELIILDDIESLLVVKLETLLYQLGRAKQRAEVLRSERWTLLISRHIDYGIREIT